MKSEKRRTEASLDEIVAGIRRERVDEEAVEAAGRRISARLSAWRPAPALLQEIGQNPGQTVVQIEGCADFQALIPAYIAKTLPEARSLLVQDHVLECVVCRRALNLARSGLRPVTLPKVGFQEFRAKPKRSNWAVGAAIAAVLLLGVGLGLIGTGNLFPGSGAVVETVSGNVYQVSDRTSEAVASGHPITAGQEIRTANGSSATVRLVDGSVVEMSERADLWLSRGWRGTTIHLERGNVIVQAAPQRHGRLYVATRDCQVSVKGTIFDVDEGTKGSRVSVIQGEVRVDGGGKEELLRPGDQISTEASLASVPVAEEVSWSRNSGEYLALLAERAALQRQIEAIPTPALRYQSALLKMLPEDTAFYAAIPNIGSTLGEANRLFQERIQQSEVLDRWWKGQQASGEAQATQQMIDRIRSFSGYLGDEVVVGMPAGKRSPVLLAEVRRPDFSAFLQQQLGQLNQLNGSSGPPALLVRDAAALGPAVKDRPLILVRNNILAVSMDPRELQNLVPLIDQSAASGFSSTPFYAAIQQAYQSGAGWLLAADMEQIVFHSVSKDGGRETGPGFLSNDWNGLVDMKYLILESKDANGQTQNRAQLTFSQERRGIASWLGPPSAMGTLDFVSPGASFVVSFVTKNPGEILQDILNFSGSADAPLAGDLEDFESKTGLNLQSDLAGSLGGEATFALDGPLLPTPSWKMAVEVNDPGRLEATIEKLVSSFNQQDGGQARRINSSQQTAGGRTYYELQVTPGSSGTFTPTQIDYVFVDGYLVAGPNRASLVSSIQNRETGYSLGRSPVFLSQLPRDGYANFSGMIYENLGAAVGPIAEQLKSSAALTPAQQQSIEALGENSAPRLVCAYGQPDAIVIASTGNFFAAGVETLFGLGGNGPFDVLQLIENAGREASKTPKT